MGLFTKNQRFFLSRNLGKKTCTKLLGKRSILFKSACAVNMKIECFSNKPHYPKQGCILPCVWPHRRASHPVGPRA